MRTAALLLLLAPALAAEDDRYHSLWKGLEERQDRIVKLPSPHRDNALRQYYICVEKLGAYCDAHDRYVEACHQRARDRSVSEDELKALALKEDEAWHEYVKALGELEHRITEGAVASRGDEVRPDEPVAKEAPVPEGGGAEGPGTGAPPPGDGAPPPETGPELRGPIAAAPAQAAWAAREKTVFQKLSAATRAAAGPAFEATLKALDAYAAAQGAFNAARERQAAAKDAAERARLAEEVRRLAEEARKLREAFNERRGEYLREKGKAWDMSPGAPAEDALAAYVAGVRRGFEAAGATLPEGGSWATLATLVELANRAGRSSALATDLRALEGTYTTAGQRGEKLGKMLAGSRSK